MPTYHLIIETKIKHEPTELNDYLYPHEILINSSFELTYKIINIGKLAEVKNEKKENFS